MNGEGNLKKLMIFLVFISFISLGSCSTSKIGRLDLETNYKIIEDIIQNPDTLIPNFSKNT